MQEGLTKGLKVFTTPERASPQNKTMIKEIRWYLESGRFQGLVEELEGSLREYEAAKKENVEDDSWIKRIGLWIRNIYEKNIAPFLPEIESYLPPRLSWSNDNSQLIVGMDSFSPIRLKAAYSHSSRNDDNFTVFFKWEPESNNISGGSIITPRLIAQSGLTEFGYEISSSNNGDFGITFNFAGLINELTKKGIRFAIDQLNDNPIFSLEKDLNIGNDIGVSIHARQFNTDNASYLFRMNIGNIGMNVAASGFGNGNHNLSAGVRYTHEREGILSRFGTDFNAAANAPNTLGLSASGQYGENINWGVNLRIPFDINVFNRIFSFEIFTRFSH